MAIALWLLVGVTGIEDENTLAIGEDNDANSYGVITIGEGNVTKKAGTRDDIHIPTRTRSADDTTVVSAEQNRYGSQD